MTAKKVVVFGGSGFLGSHVADCLSDTGYQVVIFDTQQSPYLRDDQQMVVGDITELDQALDVAQGALALYNFAALADIDKAHDQPVKTVEVNVLGAVTLLEAARLAKVKRFVFASSVYVFSEAGSFYRASKQAAERFVETFHSRYDLDYTVLRYGSLYGPRADPNNGVFRMLQQAIAKNCITYGGDGDAVREYIHVTDAARLSVQILEHKYANRHLVLTGTERMRVRDVMQMIAEILPGNVKLKFERGNPISHYTMTPYAYQPNIGHKLVGTDFVDLGQGLLECISDLQKHQEFDSSDQSRGNLPEIT
ncbi:MAG: NAD(P)-dependent oxidoreductase [Gammaproteobacteria bacterium]|nr:NAD(P)-dependent oxidoreductase [Gammaproteobacteria bacterium]